MGQVRSVAELATVEGISDRYVSSLLPLAFKKKGMWMGGVSPLGYATRDRKLVIVPEEAETVRLIFRRYRPLCDQRPRSSSERICSEASITRAFGCCPQ